MNTRLADIPVVTEAGAITVNLPPVLHEILHGVQRLRRDGSASVVDLQAMPFGPGERERLLALLGEGEVRAQVQALGETKIQESRFPGVWVVEHLNLEGRQIALQIEIAEVPALLRTPGADLAESEQRLQEVLEGLGARG
jgi:hydrogenase-1 operon protein HyaF